MVVRAMVCVLAGTTREVASAGVDEEVMVGCILRVIMVVCSTVVDIRELTGVGVGVGEGC